MRAVRTALYITILAALYFVPLQRIEIANLEPIQAVWMHIENGNVILETDTEDKGLGATVTDALANMKSNSSGIVYLDTAQYLLVSKAATGEIHTVQPFLKNSARLCIWDGQGNIKSAVKYADSHKIGQKIRDWEKTGNLPELPHIRQENSDNFTS